MRLLPQYRHEACVSSNYSNHQSFRPLSWFEVHCGLTQDSGSGVSFLMIKLDNGVILMPIPGININYYRAGDDGFIYSQRGKHAKLVVPWRGLKGANSGGYRRVSLRQNGKINYKVSRLVCAAFHGPCPDRMVCRHLDGTRHNDKPSNLAWGTLSENQADRIKHGTSNHGERNPNTKLTNIQRIEIQRRMFNKEKAVNLKQEYGVHKTTINRIVKNWRQL